jgi:hypothetical protein
MKNKLSDLVKRDSRVTDKSGNTGEFVRIDNNYEYRFNQYTVVNGEVVSKPTKDDAKDKPIVFSGYVAYLIERWHREDSDDLFNEYYIEQRNKYLKLHDDDDDKFLRDLDQEFNYRHKLEEILLIRKSKGIFDFLDDNQTALLKHRIVEYLNFVKSMAEEYIDSESTTTLEQPTNSKTQRTIDVEKLKTYLAEPLLIKTGKKPSKVDELVNILEANRTRKEIAEIAKYFYTNRRRLLKTQHVYSINWTTLCSIFYEIAGIKRGYIYGQTKIDDGILTQQLSGLFEIKEKHK